MFEELKRKEEMAEIMSKLNNISAKLDSLIKLSKKSETPPKMAQKQVKMDISQ